MNLLRPRVAACAICLLASLPLRAADTFRLTAYNVENYLDEPTASRKNPKSEPARAKIRESIKAANPDVLALEEIGTTNALLELRDALKIDGVDLPFWEHVTGWDTNIHVAVLSRFPIIARRPHTNDTFLLDGRRLEVSRGFSEVDIQVNSNYVFTLIGAHLKSQRPTPQADQADWRLEEAKVLRDHVESRLKSEPAANLAVVGDLNDIPNSVPIRTVIGRGKFKLEDTRPAERNGDTLSGPTRKTHRNIAWTHYYTVDDTYSRLDYILLSPGMSREWVAEETYIPTIPDWGLGSDHRPVVATFHAADK